MLLGVAILATVAGAQGRGSAKYKNDELGLRFSGVYGWASKSAWTELARYDSDRSLDSFVALLVRDNPYRTTADLREAMQKEFAVSEAEAEPAEGKPILKEVAFADVEMSKGLKLPGIQAEAIKVGITAEGKRRERVVVSRTYFGKNRLFRIHCEARRARAKRVRDLFDRALAGLVVTAADERASRGTTFHSQRGEYRCMVPEGFAVYLSKGSGPRDISFIGSREGVTVSVISYRYDLTLEDQLDEMASYYGDDLKFDNEQAKALGGDAFLATITTDKKVTLVVGTVRGGRAYRVHTHCPPDKVDAAREIHERFLKTFKITAR